MPVSSQCLLLLLLLYLFYFLQYEFVFVGSCFVVSNSYIIPLYYSVVRVNTQNDITTIISQKNQEAKEKHNVQRKKLDSLRILSSSSSQGEL